MRSPKLPELPESPEFSPWPKIERRCQIIDIAVPGDKRVEMKEQEKIENYSKLKREVKKIWKMSQVAVVPIFVGALGVTSKKLND